MAENENVAVKPSKGKRAKGAVKEWFRKKIVALKVKPQIIPLVFMVITTVYFLLVLFNVSRAIDISSNDPHTPTTGICIFITTLLSLLYLVSFLNAFPRRKKPNVFFLVLVGVMIAGQVACDLVYYVQMNACIANITSGTAMYNTVKEAQPFVLGHVILLGISAVVFALLPVYGRLIKKINTSVKLESATENMQGQIDIQE